MILDEFHFLWVIDKNWRHVHVFTPSRQICLCNRLFVNFDALDRLFRLDATFVTKDRVSNKTGCKELETLTL